VDFSEGKINPQSRPVIFQNSPDCGHPWVQSISSGREQMRQIASYSMTSSAATSRPGGTLRPSAFAVLAAKG
jgi:hypothetical protein